MKAKRIREIKYYFFNIFHKNPDKNHDFTISKTENIKKKSVKLIYFILQIFGQDFFKFSGPQCNALYKNVIYVILK